MPKKTNKTSHVMDLLTNGASGESNEPDNSSAAAEDSAAAAEKKNNVQSTTVTPSKVTVVDEASRNDRLSQEILNNLSEELQKETGQAPAAEASNKTMSPDEIAAAFAAAQAPETPTAPPAPAPEASNKTMSPDEIAAAFAAAQAPQTSTASAAPAPEASNKTMSPDEIAAAFAAAQAPQTSTAPAAPAPEASNKTMRPDEIAAAFAAAQAPQTSTASAAPAPEASNKTMSPDEIAAAFAAAQAPETSPAPAAPEASVTPPAPAPQPAAPAQPAKPTPRSIIPKSQISENLTDDQYRFVNVMEQLILRQDIHGFLKQYNVCTCRRCMSDVCALALTGLPSKYVVVSNDSLSPLLSYYESKYKIYMLTELIKACNLVRENPRHQR